MRTEIGKISNVLFGRQKDYPFLFGLQLTFTGKGWGVTGSYMVNISDECRWERYDRREAITKIVDRINRILTDAKVTDVYELKNVPVEVTFDGQLFHDFRILTEVL